MDNSRLNVDFASVNFCVTQLQFFWFLIGSQLAKQQLCLLYSLASSLQQAATYPAIPIYSYLSIYLYQSSYLSRHSYLSIAIQLATYSQLHQFNPVRQLVTHKAERNQSAWFLIARGASTQELFLNLYSYVDDQGGMGTLTNQPSERCTT